jgi:hypothetical protein
LPGVQVLSFIKKNPAIKSGIRRTFAPGKQERRMGRQQGRKLLSLMARRLLLVSDAG